MSNFQPPEVVDRGSETQPQVVENLNKLNWTRTTSVCLFLITVVYSVFERDNVFETNTMWLIQLIFTCFLSFKDVYRGS